MSELPRRLRAERLCVDLLGKGCAVVDVDGCERYAIAICADGVAAVVGDADDRGRFVVAAEAARGAALPAFGVGVDRGRARWLARDGDRAYAAARTSCSSSVMALRRSTPAGTRRARRRAPTTCAAAPRP